jgi:hypothetical protein
VSEAVFYIHDRYGVYMDVQRFWRLHNNGGYFELRKFPGQPWRVKRSSIDAAYEGVDMRTVVGIAVEPEEAASTEAA